MAEDIQQLILSSNNDSLITEITWLQVYNKIMGLLQADHDDTYICGQLFDISRALTSDGINDCYDVNTELVGILNYCKEWVWRAGVCVCEKRI